MLTCAEAAARLGIHPSRVRHLIRDGRLPAQKWGRDWHIRVADLALVAHRVSGWPKGRARKPPDC
jgi:excisionase family DNA binding protein